MKTGLIVTAYAVGAFLTFGHVFNDNYVEPKECGAKPSASLPYSEWLPLHDAYYDCLRHNIRAEYGPAIPVAVVAGAAWPIYWAGRVAIEVTK